MASDSSHIIPVQIDGSTVKQKHEDMVSKLDHTVGGSREANRMDIDKSPDLFNYLCAPRWCNEVRQWIDDAHRTWPSDVLRMRNSVFPLVPLDFFDVKPYDPFTPFIDTWSVLDRMDRQMRALERSLTSTHRDKRRHSGSLVPHIESGTLDFLNDAYEMGEDGRLHFKVRFDMSDYNPEDIEVKTSKHGLTVHAKKSVQSDTGSSTREYFRSIYLPASVEKDQFTGRLTEDKILTLDAPVRSDHHKSIAFNRDRQVCVRPQSELDATRASGEKASNALAVIGTSGLTVLTDDAGGKRMHIEIPIEPEFTADNLCVRMEANRVVVSGKKEHEEKTGTSRCAFVKEFSRSFDLPATADTLSVNAQVKGNTLLIEAPLLCAPASK